MPRPPTKCSHTILDKNCEYCLALKAKWYDKANKEGVFEDIEKDEDYLKIYSADTFRQRHAGQQAGGWQAKAEYYNLAAQFLNEYKFESEIVKVIWSYHAEGISAESIRVTLKKLRYKKWANLNLIKATLKTLKTKMFAMYLDPTIKAYYERR